MLSICSQDLSALGSPKVLRVAVIGTAGRRDDKDRLTRELYSLMRKDFETHLEYLHQSSPDSLIHLVSGGAAYADHLAVCYFLYGRMKVGLELHLPAPFDIDTEMYQNITGTGYKDPGAVSNYYHDLFSKNIGRPSRKELALALCLGVPHSISDGFNARNRRVADVDVIIAYTFGSHSSFRLCDSPNSSSAAGLKDGGTAHTWQHSEARLRIHRNLPELD